MPFTQTYHGPIQEVYNVDGTLLLDRNSGPSELARGLARIKADVAALPGLTAEARRQIEAGIDSALTEARGSKPDGDTIKTRLDDVAETVKSAAGLAESGRNLVETLLAIGKWAVIFLA